MKSTTFKSLQLCRALACLAVVVFHAAEMWRTRLSPGGVVVWPGAAAGVDIFFVISGFVMVLSAARLGDVKQAGRVFLWARLRRIVPLYWLCSGVKMAGLALAGDWARLGVSYCIGSLLFLPVHDAAGLFKPVLPVGWTLSFELLFYGLFALALGARLSPALYVPPVLLVLAMLPLGELANPIVLEFAYGILLAVLWRRGWLGGVWTGAALLVAAIASMVFLPAVFPGMRFLDWGVPAALLVAGMVCLETVLARFLPRMVLGLGDASYAIYLTMGLRSQPWRWVCMAVF